MRLGIEGRADDFQPLPFKNQGARLVTYQPPLGNSMVSLGTCTLDSNGRHLALPVVALTGAGGAEYGI